MKRELTQVLYSKLNGQAGFESFILYCQLQILVMVLSYEYAIYSAKSFFIEIKEMELLESKGGPQWQETYGDLPGNTMYAVIMSISLIMLIYVFITLSYCFGLVSRGIVFSQMQDKSRIRGFFLVVGCIVLPIYECYLAFRTRQVREYVKDVRELEHTMMPDTLLWIIYAMSITSAVLAVLGFIAMACTDRSLV